ncbi:FAD binding oxidoreductase [Schizosaccharomyces octosporus yFS286]|uniref:FAD binding oxidoreductase n=1 Tax=Schizosaccharomyces octosporus (strain yFS286) TaxID=483514 RepID=S9RF58_SCHOY|nr:FAD binding oxidoreductase [Schizosaccharomyces octosporus yFS286]EPX72714.1 FAD binding oxidoreductase [Schizosaccharomyces octosporus yFS286]
MGLKILLVNGAHPFGHSQGKLNETLQNVAKETLTDLGHTVHETVVTNGYVIEEEIEKIVSSDVVIYQFPGWWMGLPWPLKKYIDEVFTIGYGKLFASDGRSHTNPTKNYGKGGLLHGKSYMLSTTWNAPCEAFNEFGNFFDGRGIDNVLFPVHKAHEFLAMTALPSFMANDVLKNPQVDTDISAYKLHLQKVLPGK